MASQNTWGYDDAFADFNRTGNLLNVTGLDRMPGVGSYTPSRSWQDILRDNAYQMYGQQAYQMSPAQLEQIAQQNGILGGKEQGFGEIAMEGLTGPLAIPAAFLAAGALTGAFGGATGGEALLAGGGEVGSGYAASAPGSSLGGSGGSGMWEWLDDYSGGDWGDVADLATAEDAATGRGMIDMARTQGTELSPLWNSNTFGGGSSFLKNLGGLNTVKSLFTGGGPGGQTQGGSILNQFLGDPLGAAFNMTPFLLALNEANNQSDDLNSVIGKINGEGYQRAVLNPYDLETGLGRTAMSNDLDLRGVSGSSFGYQSLNNYDYMRALGRGDLASKAGLAAAGLEGNLVNQRNTNRNLLLGAGLNASGRMFQPQQDPFNLRALLGA